MRRVYAQLPCVIVTYIPGKDLVAAKIGISRKGCSKRPICTQLRGPQLFIPRGERIISEKSDLFLLRWLGKHVYTLNMFHNEYVNCSIMAMVLKEMDD